MIDWESGTYIATVDAWGFYGGDLEIIVGGTIGCPNAHWLSVAKDVMAAFERHHAAACDYLNTFVNRSKCETDAE